MPTGRNRRRLEIDKHVYNMLEAEARWLHVPVTALATMLIRDELAARGGAAGNRDQLQPGDAAAIAGAIDDAELEEEHDRLEATEYGLAEDVRTIAQRTQHRAM